MKGLACMAFLLFCGCSANVPPSRKESLPAPDAKRQPSQPCEDSSEQDIIGWGGVPWAALREKALSILSARYSPIDATKKQDELSVDFKIETHEYIALLIFRNTAGLERVIVTPKSKTDSVASEIGFNVLMEGMTNKYGIPSESSKASALLGCEQKTWTWIRKHGWASLKYCVSRDTHFSIVSLVYGKREVLPEL
jgi:hypothetical protein